MTPTIVPKNNFPYLVVAHRRNYDTNSVFQTIVNILREFKMSTSDAVNKTKVPSSVAPGSDHGGKRIEQVKDQLKIGYK